MSKFTIPEKALPPLSSRPWVPHKYQKKSVRWLLEHDAAALFLDPGLGKTSITYAALASLKEAELLRGAVVVAPRRPAVSVWPSEHEKWSEFSDLKVVLLHGDHKDKAVLERADVYVVTYEGFQWLTSSGHLDKLLKKKWLDTLIFDELSKLKHPSTSRFKRLKPWLAKFARRWGLTGSPAPNGLMDLFGQAYVLDRGAALGQYVTHFRAAYFTPQGKYQGDPYPVWTPKEGAEDAIYARMANLALRIDAEDHLELPQLILNPIKCELPPALRKQYKQMEEEMFAELEGQVVTAATAATVSMKCRQLTSGAIYEDLIDANTGEPRVGKRKWLPLHDLKIELLLDLIDELQGQQLLIAYEYQHESARIAKALNPRKPEEVPCIGGGVSDKKALAWEAAWNAGQLPVLMGHPQSMGHGLNLQGSGAHNVCWFSGTWDYELYDQFIRRLKRQGNTAKHVFVHHLIARDTVDEAVLIAMQRKRKGQNALLDALKNFRS